MCLNFAHKASEAVTWFDLKEKGIVDDGWINAIKEAVLKMEGEFRGKVAA